MWVCINLHTDSKICIEMQKTKNAKTILEWRDKFRTLTLHYQTSVLIIKFQKLRLKGFGVLLSNKLKRTKWSTEPDHIHGHMTYATHGSTIQRGKYKYHRPQTQGE